MPTPAENGRPAVRNNNIIFHFTVLCFVSTICSWFQPPKLRMPFLCLTICFEIFVLSHGIEILIARKIKKGELKTLRLQGFKNPKDCNLIKLV